MPSNNSKDYGYNSAEVERIYKLIFIGRMPKLISHNKRKARSDATVEFMIRQYQGQTMWASNLSAVFHGTTMSDRRRFYFECSKRGVEVQNEKTIS